MQFPIQLDCGPEVLTGSTRLKAGTAQKMVCNMITTAAMVRLGKTYQNLMVDLDVSNEKLYHRWLSIVQTASGCTLQQAQELYRSAHHNAKAAICMARCGLTYPQAVEALDRAGGMVRQVLAQKQ